MKKNIECKNPWLCGVFGFFLPILGLIIGAIIGKGTGVKIALLGAVLRWACVVGFFLFLFVVGSAIETTRESAKRAHSANAERVKSGEPAPAQSAWKYSTQRSPIDDTTTHILRCKSVEEVDGGIRSGHAVLIIRRKEGADEAYIKWPGFVGTRETPVTVRFDKDEAITEDWGCATDGKAVFSPFPFDDFWGMVKDSRQLVVRLTPYGESPATVTFKLSGIPADALRAFNR